MTCRTFYKTVKNKGNLKGYIDTFPTKHRNQQFAIVFNILNLLHIIYMFKTIFFGTGIHYFYEK